MELTLTLSEIEVKAILNVLGQLATNTGAYPLMMNIERQLQAQLPAEQQEEA